jgi:hypothetical protein
MRMPSRPSVLFFAIAAIVTSSLSAQEPNPARLNSGSFDDSSVGLTLPWRYAPGDEPGRANPAYDDSRWTTVAPALTARDREGGAWTGIGWFRRHVEMSPEVGSKMFALRLAAPGAARLYLDGRELLAIGSAPAAEIPGPRSDSVVVRLDPGMHVFAVRYAHPPSRDDSPIGFTLRIAPNPGVPDETTPEWMLAGRGAVIAIPVVLALLHLALFGFDRRAREHLFYALEMLAFAALIVNEYYGTLGRFAAGMPIIAIFFGALTYYALRTPVWPKSWRLFAVAGVILYFVSILDTRFAGYAWMPYFVALVVENVRLERASRTVERRGVRFYLWSFAVFGLFVVLQILVNFGVVAPPFGIRQVYVIGILVAAAGMSLYLASTMGYAQIQEAEHQRKTLELSRARDLQLSMLPRTMPHAPGLEIAAVTHTAAEVGGDYYDARTADDGSLLFAFGDATGHGLSAGIVVTAAKALFTSLPPGAAPRELLAHCDGVMASMNLPSLRMCLALARVSPQHVSVASAAMPPLLIRRASTGDVEELGTGGLPLGGRLPQRFEEHSAALAPGDTLLFASDGLAESSAPDGRQLGYDGVIEAFRRAGDAADAQQVIARRTTMSRWS